MLSDQSEVCSYIVGVPAESLTAVSEGIFSVAELEDFKKDMKGLYDTKLKNNICLILFNLYYNRASDYHIICDNINYRSQGEGNVFTGACLSTIALFATRSLLGLVIVRLVRILLECFLVNRVFCQKTASPAM